ncbi:hypothetical protein PIB30_034854 [Stylosanthes scabra]|uniref:Uncharacterized protein n=1 Tax=Stylosanthes scabra TaxID=79078 RepID=A0ABU6ZBD2_9FABA|nr:hypothetical protein [Stylosanthes scabra]
MLSAPSQDWPHCPCSQRRRPLLIAPSQRSVAPARESSQHRCSRPSSRRDFHPAIRLGSGKSYFADKEKDPFANIEHKGKSKSSILGLYYQFIKSDFFCWADTEEGEEDVEMARLKRR